VVELREHHRGLEKGAVSNAPSVETGDIVTVMEEEKSNRGMWKLIALIAKRYTLAKQDDD